MDESVSPKQVLQQKWDLPHDIAQEIEKLVALLVQEYIVYWYKTISSDTDLTDDLAQVRSYQKFGCYTCINAVLIFVKMLF